VQRAKNLECTAAYDPVRDSIQRLQRAKVLNLGKKFLVVRQPKLAIAVVQSKRGELPLRDNLQESIFPISVIEAPLVEVEVVRHNRDFHDSILHQWGVQSERRGRAR